MLRRKLISFLLATGLLVCIWSPSAAALHIEGQVRAAGSPVANSTVTLWSATAGEPRQLAQTRAGSGGAFQLDSDESPEAGASLYVIAKGGEAAVNKGSGDNPAVVMLAVLGHSPPSSVVVNEMRHFAPTAAPPRFGPFRSEAEIA